MNIARLIRTIVRLRPLQVFYQVKYRLIKNNYVTMEAPSAKIPGLKTKAISKIKCVKGETFSFELNT